MVTVMPPVKRWVLPAATLLLLRAVPSCSSDAATAMPTEVELKDVPGLLAETICKVTLDCLGPASTIAATRSDCVDTFTRQFEDGEFALIQQAIDDGTVDYDGTVVTECTRGIERAGCDILTTRLKTICPDLVSGEIAGGDECSLDAQCEDGHFCKMSAACPGTCTPLGSSGEPCDQTDDCRDGLLCDGVPGTCLAPAADGEACRGDTGRGCGPASYCAGASGDEAGTCRGADEVFSRARGESCDPTAGDFCEPESVCAATGVEDGQIVFECEAKAEETACHVAIPEACPEGRYCVLTGDTAEGECQSLPGDGEPCGKAAPQEVPTRCRPNSVCVMGTCRQIHRLGESCSIGAECYSGVCTEGSCRPTICSAE